ncbi:MAG: SUF system Fe-S cluster assembly regulator [Proteobacteria bacterium]|nr:SUF system Fe-S cluster assembly regulator [Pseudomonadota bacterium]
MLRLSKITDYGIVLLARLATHPDERPQNARELALEAQLPVPVVSKVLKSLARRDVLESHRGAKGGYTLARHPADITVAEMITALEGPFALMECNLGPDLCQHEESCGVRAPWQRINRVVFEALTTVSLADLIDPAFPRDAWNPAPLDVDRHHRLPADS